MTLLLAFEAVHDGRLTMETPVPVSEHAYHMGGSQIWLEPGEQMTLDDMLKAICISSANDAAVAVAEYVGGSETAFAEMMNVRAYELGMTNTHFVNACGLDEAGHLSTARDVALMSREMLLHHTEVRDYCSIWMDTLRVVRPSSSTPTSSCAFTPARRGSRPARPIRPNTASARPQKRTAWSSSRSSLAAARVTSAFPMPKRF